VAGWGQSQGSNSWGGAQGGSWGGSGSAGGGPRLNASYGSKEDILKRFQQETGMAVPQGAGFTTYMDWGYQTNEPWAIATIYGGNDEFYKKFSEWANQPVSNTNAQNTWDQFDGSEQTNNAWAYPDTPAETISGGVQQELSDQAQMGAAPKDAYDQFRDMLEGSGPWAEAYRRAMDQFTTGLLGTDPYAPNKLGYEPYTAPARNYKPGEVPIDVLEKIKDWVLKSPYGQSPQAEGAQNIPKAPNWWEVNPPAPQQAMEDLANMGSGSRVTGQFGPLYEFLNPEGIRPAGSSALARLGKLGAAGLGAGALIYGLAEGIPYLAEKLKGWNESPLFKPASTETTPGTPQTPGMAPGPDFTPGPTYTPPSSTNAPDFRSMSPSFTDTAREVINSISNRLFPSTAPPEPAFQQPQITERLPEAFVESYRGNIKEMSPEAAKALATLQGEDARNFIASLPQTTGEKYPQVYWSNEFNAPRVATNPDFWSILSNDVSLANYRRQYLPGYGYYEGMTPEEQSAVMGVYYGQPPNQQLVQQAAKDLQKAQRDYNWARQSTMSHKGDASYFYNWEAQAQQNYEKALQRYILFTKGFQSIPKRR
jgi:hypothetical protein